MPIIALVEEIYRYLDKSVIVKNVFCLILSITSRPDNMSKIIKTDIKQHIISMVVNYCLFLAANIT